MKTTYDIADALPGTFRVLVSPGAGRLRFLPPARFTGGVEMVEAGQPVARLEQGRGDVIMRAPVSGRVAAIMGLEGEPLVAGSAILAIEPVEDARSSAA